MKTNHSEKTIENMNYAYRERKKGRTYKSIGEDIGLSAERVRAMIRKKERYMRAAKVVFCSEVDPRLLEE